MTVAAKVQRCGSRRPPAATGAGRPAPAAALAELRVRRATPADAAQVEDLLRRRGHGGGEASPVAIVATCDDQVVAVAVGSTGGRPRRSDCAIEAGWAGLGLGALLGRALGEALCAPDK
jgi:hypothetical protein